MQLPRERVSLTRGTPSTLPTTGRALGFRASTRDRAHGMSRDFFFRNPNLDFDPLAVDTRDARPASDLFHCPRRLLSFSRGKGGHVLTCVPPPRRTPLPGKENAEAAVT